MYVCGIIDAMKSERVDICIVGGGASGLAAAITAARAGRSVVVLECDYEHGRSIKRTGDGRCNIANAHTHAGLYRNECFVEQAFRACSPERALAFLESCGLVLRQESEGRLYPQANKATSVVDALLLAAQRAGVRIELGCSVTSVLPYGDAWQVAYDRMQLPQTSKRVTARDLAAARAHAQAMQLQARSVVYCAGGDAPTSVLPATVKVHPSVPVLGPLATDVAPIAGLDKVRVKCALQSGDVREEGEVTFREYGVSGIAAFNLSRLVRPGDVIAIDFLPACEGDSAEALLQRRLGVMEPCTAEEFCVGMLLPEVAHAVLHAAGLKGRGPMSQDGVALLARTLKAFPLVVKGLGDERLCQVHRGGVAVEAVRPETMEVAGQPGLYVCGEALDVDAPCGGYNLHWAWVSGIVAGEAASVR
ncbi:aminoacetone oxidase family FAD-binding enzyme [Denitrobacterium detoxificans]|jgi:hypothetical protein|uniref:aminoacetone oxidase family FAD-binding enzyme n=1 Tax=Denitrobacterium detoxificans TaxID=79604 RepID=UPI0026EBF970|nr:aminoacetone oxidase family FAD-binding enzyme [Denitrobacterium detoxificans]MBE6466502.1 aminoacetone oxidase family FAD-binding enzyme [Denitrobacterium detoxificans]